MRSECRKKKRIRERRVAAANVGKCREEKKNWVTHICVGACIAFSLMNRISKSVDCCAFHRNRLDGMVSGCVGFVLCAVRRYAGVSRQTTFIKFMTTVNFSVLERVTGK